MFWQFYCKEPDASPCTWMHTAHLDAYRASGHVTTHVTIHLNPTALSVKLSQGNIYRLCSPYLIFNTLSITVEVLWQWYAIDIYRRETQLLSGRKGVLIYVVARINPQFSQFLKREMPAPQLPVLPRLLAPRDVSCLPGPLVSPTAILISPYPIPLPPVSLHAKIGRIAPLCPRLCNAKAIFLSCSRYYEGASRKDQECSIFRSI